MKTFVIFKVRQVHLKKKRKSKATHFPADLVTFTEEIYNGKLYFLCSDRELCF